MYATADENGETGNLRKVVPRDRTRALAAMGYRGRPLNGNGGVANASTSEWESMEANATSAASVPLFTEVSAASADKCSVREMRSSGCDKVTPMGTGGLFATGRHSRLRRVQVVVRCATFRLFATHLIREGEAGLTCVAAA